VETFFGDTKKKDRAQIVTDFQKGKIRFLVANPQSAGTGLNLQRSTLHYYYSNGTKAEDRWQSEDRSHRSGQKNHVVYKDIIIKKTVDDSIQKILKENKTLSEFFKQPLEDII
jgi:SNF2 family DNA or RNA helicase